MTPLVLWLYFNDGPLDFKDHHMSDILRDRPRCWKIMELEQQDLESVAERQLRSARDPQRISSRNCPKFWMMEVEEKRKNCKLLEENTQAKCHLLSKAGH